MSLRQALTSFKTRKQLPRWIRDLRLPGLRDEEGPLEDAQVNRLLLMLRTDAPVPEGLVEGGPALAEALLKAWGVHGRHHPSHGWVTRAALLGDEGTARLLETKASLLARGSTQASGMCVKALEDAGHEGSLVRLSQSGDVALAASAGEALERLAHERGVSVSALVEASFDWRQELRALEKPRKLAPWLDASGIHLQGADGPWDAPLVEGLLRAAMADALHPYRRAVRAAATPASLDAMCVHLLERWETKDFHGRSKWIRPLLEAFGGDGTALALESRVVAWPGESETGRRRAVDFLSLFRAIGTDTALLVLLGLRQKVVAPSLIDAARQELRRAAEDRKLEVGELKDRLTPTCGLDRFGGRRFDYGTRAFHLVVDDKLRPRLKDDAGEPLQALPQPNDADDPVMAEAARGAWGVLEATLNEVMEVQAHRLEEDMVLARRWPVRDWRRWVLDHPLMVHFARRLVWARFDGDQLVQGFRATEELELVDHDDEPLELGQEGLVGLPHPLDLTTEQRAAWGEQLADYEVVQPFPQLGREVFGLEGRGQVDHYARIGFRSGVLRDVLVLAEYERDPDLHRTWYEKHFPRQGVTARVTLSPGVYAGGARYDVEDQTVPLVRFRRGRTEVPADEVPAAVLSEVRRDLEQARDG